LKEQIASIGVKSIDSIKAEGIKFINEWDFSRAKRNKALKSIGQIVGVALLTFLSSLIGYIL
jgi:cytosine/uracil/thiamine/allantoin permease